MNKIKKICEYRKCVLGKSIKDFLQWEKEQKKEIEQLEDYMLMNRIKYLSILKFNVDCYYDKEEANMLCNNYVTIIITLSTLFVSLFIGCVGNIGALMIMLGESKVDNNKIKEFTEIYLRCISETINEGSKIIIGMVMAIFLVMALCLLFRKYKKESYIWKKNYCDDILSMLYNEKENRKL